MSADCFFESAKTCVICGFFNSRPFAVKKLRFYSCPSWFIKLSVKFKRRDAETQRRRGRKRKTQCLAGAPKGRHPPGTSKRTGETGFFNRESTRMEWPHSFSLREKVAAGRMRVETAECFFVEAMFSPSSRPSPAGRGCLPKRVPHDPDSVPATGMQPCLCRPFGACDILRRLPPGLTPRAIALRPFGTSITKFSVFSS